MSSGRWRDLTIDTGPLRRNREYRLLSTGLFVTAIGSGATFVALPYQVYQRSGSSATVGLLSGFVLAPVLITALVGGALADAIDRRHLVRVTEATQLVLAVVLAVNTALFGGNLLVIFLAAAGMAAVDGLQRPSLQAMIPRLVPPADLKAVAVLNMFRGTVARVVGLTGGGIVIAHLGITTAYAVDAGSFALSLVVLLRVRATPPPTGADSPGLRSVVEGARYAAGRPDLLGTYVVDITAMFFGMPTALFPAIAARYGGADRAGLLYSALFVGSFVVSVTSGWTARVHRHGRAITVGAMVWGLGIVAFGLAPGFWWAFFCVALAGAGDAVSGIFRMTLWNETIPDEYRGRLAGIEMISYLSGPRLGDVEAGIVAQRFGLRTSIVSGGILCIAGTAAVGAALPALWRYDARAPRAVSR